MRISGTFSVELKPLENYTVATDGNTLARMSIDKTFIGELDATSIGEMLSVRTPVSGAAGYVALEQVSGTLDGKRGSFVLQHFGLMHDNEQHLILQVVPGSATGELTGLGGEMAIRIDNGQHYYDFEFDL